MPLGFCEGRWSVWTEPGFLCLLFVCMYGILQSNIVTTVVSISVPTLTRRTMCKSGLHLRPVNFRGEQGGSRENMEREDFTFFLVPLLRPS